jgi:hypothetical protein
MAVDARSRGAPMSSKEKWTVVLIAVLTICVANSPYLLAYASESPRLSFGGVVMNFEDAHGYLAKMNQGAAGRLTYEIPFTSEDHEGAFVGGFFLVLGWICALTGLPVIWMWHLSRLILGFFLLLSAYSFIAYFVEDAGQRLVSYLLVCFGGGFGWLVLLTGRFSILGFDLIDFKMPEAHIFFTLLTFPHFALGAGLLVAVFVSVLLLHRTRRWRYAGYAGLSSFVLAVVHPYNLLVVACTLGLWLLVIACRKRRVPLVELTGAVVAGLMALPVLAYYLYVFNSNPAFGAWATQSGSGSPHPLHYFFGYGPLLILGLPAMVREARKADTESILPTIWIVVVAILVYAPLKQQRRMVEGVHIPLSVLATMGLYSWYLPRLEQSKIVKRLVTLRQKAYSPRRMRNFIIFVVLVLTVPSNLYILASLTATVVQHPYPFFHERAENEAIDWLASETEYGDTVLTAYGTGSYIPARIDHRVFVGYWAETADFDTKLNIVDRFFRVGTPDTWRIQTLEQYGIAYVYSGPRERILGDFDPGRVDYLTPAFSNDLVSIYRVKGLSN